MGSLSLLVAASLAATPLTLDEVRAAARKSLDAVRAELDVTRATAGTKGARSVIFPQLDFTFGAGVTFLGPQRMFSTVPVFDQATGQLQGFEQRVVDTNAVSQGRFSLGLQLNQLLYDGGRWWNQIAQAGAQEEAAKGQLLEQQLSSELEATRRFFELVKAQVALQVLEEGVKRSREQVARATGLYEAGRAQRGAVYDASTNLGNDEINVVRQKQRLVQARLALLQWLGRRDEDVVAVVPAGLDQPGEKPVADALVESARTRRPLFQALEAQVRAGDRGVDVARADYFPRLAASASYSRMSPAADPFFTDPSKQNSLALGVSLSWDLFSGFQHEAAIERARADASQARTQEGQALIDLEAEIRRAVDACAAEIDVLAIAERNLAQSKEQLTLEEERFNAGAGSSLEVRNAQIKYTQAQLAVLQGRADVATARAAVARAVGGTP